MYYAFESCYGYSSSIRLGRIYCFSSREYIVYLLEVNKDLRLLNHIFRKFSRHVRKYLFYKNIKKYITIQDILDRELGIVNIHYLIREICRKHNITNIL
jgi:hypothetical protein